MRSIGCRLCESALFYENKTDIKFMDIKEQTCCFTGHRIIAKDEKNKIFDKTREVVIFLIKNGVKFFEVGGAIGFDTIAAHVVLSLKDEFPFIKLTVVCPCRDQDVKWRKSDKAVYRDILARADDVVVLADAYFEGCMQLRNERLVDNSKYCVCFLKHKGGTQNTVDYARSKDLFIFNVAE